MVQRVGADGLFILQRLTSANRTFNVRVYLRHWKKSMRSARDRLQDIQKGLGSEASTTLLPIVVSMVLPMGFWVYPVKKDIGKSFIV